jgi:hypothetical protein
MTITTTATTATRLMDMQLDACTPAGPAVVVAVDDRWETPKI